MRVIVENETTTERWKACIKEVVDEILDLIVIHLHSDEDEPSEEEEF